MQVAKLGTAVPTSFSTEEDRADKVQLSTVFRPSWLVVGLSKTVFETASEIFIEKLTPKVLELRKRFPVLKTFKSGISDRGDDYKAELEKLCTATALEVHKTSFEKPIRLILSNGAWFKPKYGDWRYCLYKGDVYKFDRVGYTVEEMLLQIIDLEDKERQKFERLRNRLSLATKEENAAKRQPIPEEVRIAVWRRDGGQCVKCGGRKKLEYDHIIPLVKGGSDTVRNIELLCEKCNREKSENIQ